MFTSVNVHLPACFLPICFVSNPGHAVEASMLGGYDSGAFDTELSKSSEANLDASIISNRYHHALAGEMLFFGFTYFLHNCLICVFSGMA